MKLETLFGTERVACWEEGISAGLKKRKKPSKKRAVRKKVSEEEEEPEEDDAEASPAQVLKGLFAVFAALQSFRSVEDASLHVEVCFDSKVGTLNQELTLEITGGEIVIAHSGGYALHKDDGFRKFCKSFGVESDYDDGCV